MKAIIGKFYNDLDEAIKELDRQNKDTYLKHRQPVIIKIRNKIRKQNGYLVVTKNIAEKIN